MKAIDNDLSDEERRKVAKERLEALGWVFELHEYASCGRDAFDVLAIDPGGGPHCMTGPHSSADAAYDKAIRFASMAQAKAEARGKP